MATRITYTNYQKPRDFIKLVVGDNIIRVLTEPYIVYEHGARMKGKFTPLGECKGEGCDLCIRHGAPKQVFRWGAINRTTGEFGILNAGLTIGDGIMALGKALGENPKSFDIIINRVGTERDNTVYSEPLKAPESKPLTADEQARIKLRSHYLFMKYLGK